MRLINDLSGICPNSTQANLHQQPTNSAQSSRRGQGTRADSLPEAVPRYKFYSSGANRQLLRSGCGAAAAECQFVSRQVAKLIKLSESDERKIYISLTKWGIIERSVVGRASAEPVRYTSASESATEHFSAARWVGDGAGRLPLR